MNNQVLDSLDKLNAAVAKGNKNDIKTFGENLLKQFAKSRKYSLWKDLVCRTKTVLGAFDTVGWVLDAIDLLNYGLKIEDVASLICKCCDKSALDCTKAAYEYLTSAILMYISDICITIATNKNMVYSLGYGSLKNYSDAGYELINNYWNFENEQEWQQRLQPIAYNKRMIEFCLKQAKEIIKRDCHCSHNNGDPNGYPNGFPVRSGVDPSGYVCEAVPSNRVEGVTTTLYYSKNKTGENAVIWDASDYDQKNPLVSDSEGHYEWYVPDGWWQVKFEKEGYETAYSEWVPVLPIQTEINVAMKSLYAPTVKYVNAYSNSVDITFSQYMDIETVNTDTVTVSTGDKQITGTIEPVNAETSFTDKNVQYASKFRFVPETTLGGDVTVTVDNVRSYNGLYIDSAYTADKTVVERIETIDVPEKIQMNYNESTDIDIQLLPESAAADVEVKVTSSDDRLLTVSSNTVTTDKNGKATVTVTGKLPSSVELYFSVESLGLSAVTTVELSMPQEDHSSHHHMDTDSDSGSDTPDTPEKPENPNDTDTPAKPTEPEKPDTKDPVEKTVIFGDIDGDGKITSADSLFILRCSVNLENFTDEQEMLADVDGDGKITSADALFVLRCSVGLKDNTKAGETIILKAS